jgi:hypothetical protein
LLLSWVCEVQPEHMSGRGAVASMLTRDDGRTVMAIADDGHRWSVAPALLSKTATAPAMAKPRASRRRLLLT